MNTFRSNYWFYSGCWWVIRVFYVAFMATFVAMGCAKSGDGDANAALPKPAFFDITGYFSVQAARLSKDFGTKSLRKSTIVEGVEETREVKDLDFQKELLLFSKSDINKPNWLDKYQVDSVFNKENNQLEQIRYSALDADLITKAVRVDFKASQVVQVHIENTSSSVAFENTQTLVFQPNVGYSIIGTQRSLFGTPEQFLVKVDFL